MPGGRGAVLMFYTCRVDEVVADSGWSETKVSILELNQSTALAPSVA